MKNKVVDVAGFLFIAVSFIVGLWLVGRFWLSHLSSKEPLVFSVIPADDPVVTKEYWQPIANYLSVGLGREINLYLVPDYAAQVEALKYGHVDFARIGSSSYVMAREYGVEIEPIVSAIKEATGLPGYYGYIVVRMDSDIEILADLSGRSFAFVDVQSSSGYVVPACALKRAGVEVGETFLSGSHEATVLAVRNGTVDAGAVAQIRYDVALEEHAIEKGELRVVWQSEMIPNVPIVVQKTMDAELRASLRDLFINMPPGLVTGPSRAGEIGYVEATDADYDIIREIRAFLGVVQER